MNNVSLMGRLVRVPELRYTQSGRAVCSFTLAVDRGIKDADGYRPADFIDCVAWNKTAEVVAKQCEKGEMLSIIGSLRVRSWESDDAVRHKAVEVKVHSLYFTGYKPAAPEPSAEDLEGDDEPLPW